MTIHTGYRPGCIGRIVELHAEYYARTVGFGAPFEAKVACELAEFCMRYADGRDGLWLAHEDGVVHGSIAIDAHGKGAAPARFRIVRRVSPAEDQPRSLCNGLRRARAIAASTWFERLHAAVLVQKYGFITTHAARHGEARR